MSIPNKGMDMELSSMTACILHEWRAWFRLTIQCTFCFEDPWHLVLVGGGWEKSILGGGGIETGGIEETSGGPSLFSTPAGGKSTLAGAGIAEGADKRGAAEVCGIDEKHLVLETPRHFLVMGSSDISLSGVPKPNGEGFQPQH